MVVKLISYTQLTCGPRDTTTVTLRQNNAIKISYTITTVCTEIFKRIMMDQGVGNAD